MATRPRAHDVSCVQGDTSNRFALRAARNVLDLHVAVYRDEARGRRCALHPSHREAQSRTGQQSFRIGDPVQPLQPWQEGQIQQVSFAEIPQGIAGLNGVFPFFGAARGRMQRKQTPGEHEQSEAAESEPRQDKRLPDWCRGWRASGRSGTDRSAIHLEQLPGYLGLLPACDDAMTGSMTTASLSGQHNDKPCEQDSPRSNRSMKWSTVVVESGNPPRRTQKTLKMRGSRAFGALHNSSVLYGCECERFAPTPPGRYRSGPKKRCRLRIRKFNRNTGTRLPQGSSTAWNYLVFRRTNVYCGILLATTRRGR